MWILDGFLDLVTSFHPRFILSVIAAAVIALPVYFKYESSFAMWVCGGIMLAGVIVGIRWERSTSN